VDSSSIEAGPAWRKQTAWRKQGALAPGKRRPAQRVSLCPDVYPAKIDIIA
jgi:hypothetical protein